MAENLTFAPATMREQTSWRLILLKQSSAMARYFSVSTDQQNIPYAEAEEAAQRIWTLTLQALKKGEADLIPDETVRRIMTAAIKLYAAKADGGMRTFRAVEGNYDEVVTPTEALTAATE